MRLTLEGHEDDYSVYSILKCFFPYEKIGLNQLDENICESSMKFTGLCVICEIYLKYKDKEHRLVFENRDIISNNAAQRRQKNSYRNFLKRCVYHSCEALLGKGLEWGILTGIRPAKLLRELLEKNSLEQCIDILSREYLVSMSKIRLIAEVLQNERAIIDGIGCKDISLYISIPFCKTRCSYCSFVSHSIDRGAYLIDDYLKLLSGELLMISKLILQKSLNLRAIYIGGGTPTVLNERQLFWLFDLIKDSFDLKSVKEYTLEAGRADTITQKKLDLARLGEVNRIGINPQSMNDSVLKVAGRNHSASDVIDAYAMAVDAGFKNINMDIIAGLEGDSYESFKRTLDEILKLGPAGITVHALSVKKGADILKGGLDFLKLRERHEIAKKMVEHSQKMLAGGGYLPYYLYRQKSTLANLENIGYSKPGYFGLYNVYIMEEVMTVLALGAGGVSKIILPKNRLERVFNHKYPYEYNSDFKKITANIEKIAALL